VVAMANRLAEPGSTESRAFQDALTVTEGVTSVRSIVLKEPATAYEVESVVMVSLIHSRQESKKDKPWKAIAIGGVAIVILLICLITSIVLFKRNQQSAKDDAEAKPSSHVDVEAGTDLVEANAVVDSAAAIADTEEEAKAKTEATVDDRVILPEKKIVEL